MRAKSTEQTAVGILINFSSFSFDDFPATAVSMCCTSTDDARTEYHTSKLLDLIRC